MLYHFFRLASRLALRLYFRRVEVEGSLEAFAGGPVILVCNHTNAFVDALLLVVLVGRRVTLTAKSTLRSDPYLRLIMWILGAVALQRREDAEGAEDRAAVNAVSLRRCRQLLAAKGAIAFFPEGASHSDPRLRPFRLGAARIALEAAGTGVPRVRIVPVGLLYTAKHRFRSDVLARFGNPLDVSRWMEAHPQGDAVALTAELQSRVASLTLSYASRREAALVRFAAKLATTDATMPSPLDRDGRRAVDHFRLIGRLQRGYRTLLRLVPQEVEQVAAELRTYRAALRRRGIAPAEVYLPIHVGRALLFVTRELEMLLLGAPLALYGTANHVLPYRLVRRITRSLSRERDQWATNAIFSGFLVFPLCYGLQTLLVALLLSPWVAAAYALSLPYAGYVALLYGERTGSAWRRARTFLGFLREPAAQSALAAEGRRLLGRLRELEANLPLEAEPDAEGPLFAARAHDLEAELQDDAALLRQVVAGLGRLEEKFLAIGPELHYRQRGYFTPDEDDRVRQMLLAFRNYRLALWEVIDRSRGWEREARHEDRLRRFLLGYAAGLTFYSRCLRLIAAGEAIPLLRAKLNEPDLKFGLGPGFFEEILEANTSLRNRRLLAQAQRFWRHEAPNVHRLGLDRDPDFGWLVDVVRKERRAARTSLVTLFWRRLRYDWRALWRSAAHLIAGAMGGVQAALGARVAGLRFPHSPEAGAFTPAHLRGLRCVLQPADLLLFRSEARVMSALMPGFWSHVAISVGRREDLLALGLGLEARLADHLAELPPGPGAVEAISTGVRFRTLDECCFRRDHVLVLRPLLSADERRDALAEAISHLGKPYDFEFDFNVTTRIVCTELVWRSLNGRGRLDFPLVKRLGRFTLTSDDIVARLLEGAAPAGAGAPPPFDIVYLAVALRTGLYEVPEPDRLAWLRAIRAGLRPTETAGPPSRVELQEAWP